MPSAAFHVLLPPPLKAETEEKTEELQEELGIGEDEYSVMKEEVEVQRESNGTIGLSGSETS